MSYARVAAILKREPLHRRGKRSFPLLSVTRLNLKQRLVPWAPLPREGIRLKIKTNSHLLWVSVLGGTLYAFMDEFVRRLLPLLMLTISSKLGKSKNRTRISRNLLNEHIH